MRQEQAEDHIARELMTHIEDPRTFRTALGSVPVRVTSASTSNQSEGEPRFARHPDDGHQAQSKAMAQAVRHEGALPPARATPAVDPASQTDGHLSGEARQGPALRRAWCGARDTARAVLDGFEEHDLLTYASAISFQILTALVPFFLFALAVAGLLHQHAIWSQTLAPEIRANVPSATFTAISASVNKVLASKQVLWATLGGGLALWQVSGAVRAVMGALNNIYRSEQKRGFMRRMMISFALAIAVAACFVVAALSLRFAPFLFSVTHHGAALAVLGFGVRWGLAIACLGLSVGLLVHFAPATPQPLHWVSLGSLIVVATWVLTTVGFAFYLSQVASYDSLFGGLAVVIVLTAYLYLSATVFLLGALLDALIRTEAKGTAAGASHGSQATR